MNIIASPSIAPLFAAVALNPNSIQARDALRVALARWADKLSTRQRQGKHGARRSLANQQTVQTLRGLYDEQVRALLVIGWR